VPEKKTNPVRFFLGDADYASFCKDAYDAKREPSDFARWLWLEHRERKVAEWAADCEAKQRQLSDTGHGHVGAHLRGVGRNVIERDDDGFADTVQMR
jgi:hypothetical protein